MIYWTHYLARQTLHTVCILSLELLTLYVFLPAKKLALDTLDTARLLVPELGSDNDLEKLAEEIFCSPFTLSDRLGYMVPYTGSFASVAMTPANLTICLNTWDKPLDCLNLKTSFFHLN